MKDIIADHIKSVESILEIEPLIANSITSIVAAVQAGNKIMLCGNGGSAADAQHIAAELSGKFYKDRAPIDAEALHVNSSYITAVGNDLGFEKIYSRALSAKGRPGDILIALSTSGNSKNVLNALNRAKEMQITTIGMTGGQESTMNAICDICLTVSSSDTPRIQEAHILIGHIICQKVEEILFP